MARYDYGSHTAQAKQSKQAVLLYKASRLPYVASYLGGGKTKADLKAI